MRTIGGVGMLFTSLLLSVSSSGAQERASASDQLALERLVIAQWAGWMVGSDSKDSLAARIAGWAFDPRLSERRDRFGWGPSEPALRTAQESAEIAGVFGSRIVLSPDDPCTNLDCRRGDYPGLVAFTRAIVRGDTAEIDLHSGGWYYGHRRIMLKQIDRWTFVKSGEGWTMVSRRTLAIT